jgi:hypothetical protein
MHVYERGTGLLGEGCFVCICLMFWREFVLNVGHLPCRHAHLNVVSIVISLENRN